jgi:hypothetical protein
MSQSYEDKSFGVNGSVYTKTTGAVTAPQNSYFHALQVVTDAIFSSVTGNIQGDSITGVTITAGQVIYGVFSAFQLSSGSVIAYKAK